MEATARFGGKGVLLAIAAIHDFTVQETPMLHRSVLILSIAALLATPQVFSAELGKGHRILLARGIQSVAFTTRDNPFNLDTWQNGNFSGVNFEWGKWNSTLLGPAPGVQWGRWASSLSDMPPQTSPYDETPYMSRLVSVQLADEQDLNNPAVRAAAAAWLNAARASFPETLLYCNNWGGQIADANLIDFIETANPDMLSMDTYPWTTQTWAGGSPKDLYRFMRVYRAYGVAYNKPTNLWTQTYNSTGDVPARVNPSDSQLRLNYFAGAAFGFTSFMCFRYNSSSSLFVGPGDTTPLPLYASLADVNGKLRKLGPALTRLRPRVNTIGAFDAAMLYYPGQYLDGGTTVTTNTPPDGDFRVYPADYSAYFAHNNPDWVSVASPGSFRGLSVTNIGTKNNGLRGDVWLMWFEALEEEFDGPLYNDQIYMVVLNGLTDPAGSGADCRQRITLNYVNTAETLQILVLNQQSGRIDTITPPLSGDRRTPVFDLDGGEMALFKFNTGAPFVGVPASAGNWNQLE